MIPTPIAEPDRRQALGRAFDAAREGLREDIPDSDYEQRRRDFVFHMTDCLEDLEGLSAWVRHAQGGDEDEAVSNLIGMLYHVIPHLNAAGRLLLDDVADPFAGSEPQAKGP